MSIVSEVNRLKDAKTAIKTAIEGKGVTVPDATMLEGMAALIDSIEAGGKFATGTITPTDDTSGGITITHNMGVIPKIALCFREIVSTSGFGNETHVSNELLFSYAENGAIKGKAYKMSGKSYNASASLGVAKYSKNIMFKSSDETNLNGSPIGSCTTTTAVLKPAYNSPTIIFAAGKTYRWILFEEGQM